MGPILFFNLLFTDFIISHSFLFTLINVKAYILQISLIKGENNETKRLFYLYS